MFCLGQTSNQYNSTSVELPNEIYEGPGTLLFTLGLAILKSDTTSLDLGVGLAGYSLRPVLLKIIFGPAENSIPIVSY